MTATLLPVRVMVQDVWDELPLEVPMTMTVAELKRAALRVAHVTRDPDSYVLKFRGAELRDEAASLEAIGLVPNAPLIIIPRRRRPAR